ncbi:MAG TPA: universal stress protein [Candidatus Eisenbacteria bacterium]|nr:universal stress protein [Candidatus Eisenbacteria bacterium]
MNVLIGVDESPFSATAIEFVKRTPWPEGSRFRIVSVSPPIFPAAGDAAMPDVIAQLIEQQDRYHQEMAERAASGLREAGRAAEGVLISGDPRSVLVEEARRWEADLVVVGSHGRSGLKRVVLGSVAAHVASHAPCSVLIVRQPQSDSKD